MTDIFISYSRKDKSFCERLVKTLEEHGRAVWVDFDDIPFGADWWEEIQTGIEAAEAAVFIISPDSLNSQVCGLEVGHVLKNHKRLIPLLLREPGAVEIPTDISHRNWIFFNNPDEFEVGVAKLLETVDTDIEALRQHTRLLTKAREWERKGHNPSFLLYGDELAEFAPMFDTPEITELQQRFLDVSMQAQHRREMRERFEWGFVGGLLGIGFWAFSIFPSVEIITPLRLIYTLALGEVFGLFVGVLSVLADRLPMSLQRRIPQSLQKIAPIIICLGIAVLCWAVFGWFYLQYTELTQQGWNAIVFGGIGLAAGFILRILIKMSGWAAALVTAVCTYIPIYVTFDQYWAGTDIFEPLIYVSYENRDQIFTIGIPMVLLIALGANGQKIVREIRALYRRLRPVKAVKAV